MKENIVGAIKEIQNDRAILNFDEASVKTAIIQRLLSLLGWNIYDANEVKPEYAVESKAVYFALRIGDRNKVFIEVKRPSENLQPHHQMDPGRCCIRCIVILNYLEPIKKFYI